MMNKKSFLHFIAVMSFVVFIVLALACGTMQRATTATENTTASVETTSEGVVHNMPAPDGRPFEALGMVFATSVTKFNENGLEISSEEGVLIMLLREAQKLGGNDILNFRIEESVVCEQTTVVATRITRKTVTSAGSALAIRYRNN
jgi:hypothetical protein